MSTKTIERLPTLHDEDHPIRRRRIGFDSDHAVPGANPKTYISRSPTYPVNKPNFGCGKPGSTRETGVRMQHVALGHWPFRASAHRNKNQAEAQVFCALLFYAC